MTGRTTPRTKADTPRKLKHFAVRTFRKKVLASGKDTECWDVVEAPNAATAAADVMRRMSVWDLRNGTDIEVHAVGVVAGVWHGQYSNPEGRFPDLGKVELRNVA